MKQAIIRINDVSDINISKITVYDLNNRYIDSQGNIFRLKLDQFTKKIEVIKILRSHPEEAHAIANKMMQRKTEEAKVQFEEEDIPNVEYSDGSIFDEPFNPDDTLSKTLISMNMHVERLKGILMNIKLSKLSEKIIKSDVSTLDNILKNIEIDGMQQIQKTDAYQKELLGYPKHINYYQARMDNTAKAILQKLELNHQKAMKYIMYYEMHSAIKALYIKLTSLLQTLVDFLDKKSESLTDVFNPSEKRSFDDAMISIDNTKYEIMEIEKSLDKLYAFLHNPDAL